MAKLDILRGAYIGKLGATVGYKWHGTPIVRSTTWGVPHQRQSQILALSNFGILQRTLSYIIRHYDSFAKIKSKKMTKLNIMSKLNKGFLQNINGNYSGIFYPDNTAPGLRMERISETQNDITYRVIRSRNYDEKTAENIIRHTIYYTHDGYMITTATDYTLPATVIYPRTMITGTAGYIVVMAEWQQAGLIYRSNPCSYRFV